MVKKAAKHRTKNINQVRVELVTWLVMQTNPCDESGAFSHEEAMKACLQWWELPDESLIEAFWYFAMQSPMSDIVSSVPKYGKVVLQKG